MWIFAVRLIDLPVCGLPQRRRKKHGKKALAEASSILFDDEYDYDYEVVDAVEVESGI